MNNPQKHMHPPEHGEMAKTRTAPDPRIAANLRALMAAHSVSQLALSERTGVGQSTISRVLNGDDSPTTRTLAKLAAAFNVSLDAFFRHEEQQTAGLPIYPIADNAKFNPVDKTPGFRNVPVVGVARLTTGGFFEPVGQALPEGHVQVSGAAPSAYALRARGDALHPVIRDGWIVVVEPDQALTPGEFVIVGLTDGRRMIGELLFERPDSLAVAEVNGGSRSTHQRAELAYVHAVGPIFPPSRLHPSV